MCVLVAILAILNVIGFRYSTIHGSKLTEKRFSYLRVFFVGTVRPCVKVFSCEDFMVLGLQVRRMRRMTRDTWLNAGDLIPQACRRCTKSCTLCWRRYVLHLCKYCKSVQMCSLVCTLTVCRATTGIC